MSTTSEDPFSFRHDSDWTPAYILLALYPPTFLLIALISNYRTKRLARSREQTPPQDRFAPWKGAVDGDEVDDVVVRDEGDRERDVERDSGLDLGDEELDHVKKFMERIWNEERVDIEQRGRNLTGRPF